MKINFIGNGSAWNIKQNNTSAYVKKEDQMILIDCGESIARQIIRLELLNNIKKLYILITHTHSDHIGSLGTLLFYSKYRKQINNYLILPNDEIYIENIKTYLKISDISSEVQLEYKKYLKKEFKLTNFEFLKATHVSSIPCYCFVLQDKDGLIYYSGDNSNINYIKRYLKYPDSTIYTEVSNNPNLANEHLYFDTLVKNTNLEDRKRIYLMHMDQNSNENLYKSYGFKLTKPLKDKEGEKNGNFKPS